MTFNNTSYIIWYIKLYRRKKKEFTKINLGEENKSKVKFCYIAFEISLFFNNKTTKAFSLSRRS